MLPGRGVLACLLSLLVTPGANALLAATVMQQSTEQQQPPKQPSQQENPQETARSDFRLADGTLVRLRLTRALSSKDTKVGDQVEFETAEEVKVGDVVVIPRGAVAMATVTKSERRKRMGRGGKLNLLIYNVLLASGQKAPLRAI